MHGSILITLKWKNIVSTEYNLEIYTTFALRIDMFVTGAGVKSHSMCDLKP